jgi:adenylate cyclase
MDILRDKRVLVVDDMSAPRMVVSTALGHYGAQVLEAADAEEALRVAETERIDAFIVDIHMPGMGGIELCRSLRRLKAYRNTPIVFITTLEQSEALQWALDAGGDDFIHKPVQSVALRARLKSLLQKTAYLNQVELMSLSLQRYVSPRTEAMARTFAATGVLPPPQRQEVCVLFSDVRGFTELSQDVEPEMLLQILSDHLASQVNLIHGHGGYIDKFAGDGLMAVFDGENRALKCCLCALDIVDASKQHVEDLKIHQLGIGIHSGPVIIGNLGSSSRLDYTLIGKTVNLAARLCSMADRMSIVVSRAVREAVGGDPRLGFHNERQPAVRGFRDPVAVFDLCRSPAVENAPAEATIESPGEWHSA